MTVAVLAVTLLIGAPASAQAVTFPGQNGSIAFNANGKIWSVRTNGSHKKLLAPRNAQVLSWSPSGTQLAFVEPRAGGTTRIGILEMQTGSIRMLPHPEGVSDDSPVWSPDGSSIAFVRTKNTQVGKRSAVFVAALKSQVVQTVSGWSNAVSYRSPSWAPHGRDIAYEEFSESAARLLIRNIDSTQMRELVQLSDVIASSKVAWSPNGKKLLFNDSDGQVYTIWADGTHRAVISDGDSYSAAWSPDGTRIAFLEDFSGESISISEPDGSIRYVSLELGDYVRVDSPVWSPDGRQLLIHATRAGGVRDLLAITLGASQDASLVVANISATEVAWRSR